MLGQMKVLHVSCIMVFLTVKSPHICLQCMQQPVPAFKTMLMYMTYPNLTSCLLHDAAITCTKSKLSPCAYDQLPVRSGLTLLHAKAVDAVCSS